MLSAPQMIYKALYKRNLGINADGSCRLCGGPLLGNYQHCKELKWNNWLSESLIKDSTSVYICEACQKMRNFRDVGGIKIGKGFIATEEQIKFFETASDALNALYNLPEPPFVLAFIPYSSKAPLTFYLPVSYSNKHITALIAFNRGRTFRVPPVMKKGKWSTATPIAAEIYVARFDIEDAYEAIEFLQKQENVQIPEFRDLCLFDPVWGLWTWLAGKDKGLYSVYKKTKGGKENADLLREN